MRGQKVSPAIYGFYRGMNIVEGEKKMEQIVNLGLRIGIKLLIMQTVNGAFQCEKLFGDLISKKRFKREEIVLFSKCGLRVPHASQPGVRIKTL
jgi:predicted oxidoreductase